MSGAASGPSSSSPPSPPADLGRWRLAAGLAQGVALTLLYYAAEARAWPATLPPLFAALWLAVLFVPVLFISSLGHLRSRRLISWLLVATLLAGFLGWHAMARLAEPLTAQEGLRLGWWALTPSAPMLFLAALGFFMAQVLVLAAPATPVAHGRAAFRPASYPMYFAGAWKLAIQVLCSLLFVAVLWLILWLGSALFLLVKLDFLRTLLEKPWFHIAVTTCAFSVTLHLSAVRSAMVDNIRQLLLAVLAWLLPVAVMLVGAFLCLLPVTGMAPLWATRNAAGVLLSAAAILIVLGNTVFQEGRAWASQALPLRLTLRAACLLLAPLMGLALYALVLRVQQYGWTSSRILAAACLLVGSVYALGYLGAMLSRRRFASRLAATNLGAALLALLLLLLLGTPVGDPGRWSVQHQLARLHQGQVTPHAFDYDYLRFEGARYGTAALQQLRQASGPEAEVLRAGAEAALRKPHRWHPGEPVASSAERAANFTVWPQAARLPAGFLEQDWEAADRQHLLPPCLRTQQRPCAAYLIDLDEDGHAEILVQALDEPLPIAVFSLRPAQEKPAREESEEGSAAWDFAGTLSNAQLACKRLAEALAGGDYQLQPSRFQDLLIQGQRLSLLPPVESGLGCRQER